MKSAEDSIRRKANRSTDTQCPIFMNPKSEPFAIKYRPSSLEDFVMPVNHHLQKAIDFLQLPEPSAWLFWGESGLGKTSMAMLMGRAAAQSTHPYALTTYAGQQLDAAFVGDLKWQLKQGNIYGTRNVYIINEAHTIPQGGMDRLLDVLENIGDSCWFFTTTEPPKFFPRAFRSRVEPVEFKGHGICDPASKWLVKIAKKEGLNLSVAEAKGIVREANNNLRNAIGSVQVLWRRAQIKKLQVGGSVAEMQAA